jgi:hypothetical protein
VPSGTAGHILIVKVKALDSDGNRLRYKRRWRVVKDAHMRPLGHGRWSPDDMAGLVSKTAPVAGQAFTAAIGYEYEGDRWRLRCSASLGSRHIASFRQEFGIYHGTPDYRTCGFSVPPGSAGQMLEVTVDITSWNHHRPLHFTHRWRIAG